MPTRPQSYDNHVRLEPLFHFVVLPILALNFGWACYRVANPFSWDAAINLLVAAALILLALFARVFALRAQDRVIRLEMRLRMRELLPAALQPRVGEFTPVQLIAMRFASDQELPSLAERVLSDRITDRRTIKKLIVAWEADHLRV